MYTVYLQESLITNNIELIYGCFLRTRKTPLPGFFANSVAQARFRLLMANSET